NAVNLIVSGGATSIGGSGGGSGTASVNAAVGSVQLVTQGGGVSVTNGGIQAGQIILLSDTGGSFTDNGGNSYTATNGQVVMTVQSGITLAAGSSITAPLGIQLNAFQGGISLNGAAMNAGTHVNLDSQQAIGLIAQGLITLSNGQIGGLRGT